jgi:hypothetical protein
VHSEPRHEPTIHHGEDGAAGSWASAPAACCRRGRRVSPREARGPSLAPIPEQLCDAFQACPTPHPVYRRLLEPTLEELRVIEDHLEQLDQQMADLLVAHHDAVQRLAEVPGLGVDSAQQIIAGVGATAATFPSPKHLASWMGACPGNEESAGVNYSHRCPKGNRPDAPRPEPSRQCRREGPTTLNHSVNPARSGSNSCSASMAPLVGSISPFPPRLLCPRRFHCVSAAGGRLEQLRKSFSAASQEDGVSLANLKPPVARAADNVGCEPPI